jgi:hypothetical protein
VLAAWSSPAKGARRHPPATATLAWAHATTMSHDQTLAVQ